MVGNLSADAAQGDAITISTAIYDEQGRTYVKEREPLRIDEVM